MIDYSESAPSTFSLHEVIPDTKTPVYIHFDVDRRVLTETRGNVRRAIERDSTSLLEEFIHSFETTFQGFLTSLAIPLKLTLGSTYQVSSACTVDKMSAHIRVNLTCDSIQTMKTLCKEYMCYVEGNDTVPAEVRASFYYYVQYHDGRRECKPVIDDQIYRSFGCLRMLNNAKMKKGNPLIPYKTSSPALKDHLVYYPTISGPIDFIQRSSALSLEALEDAPMTGTIRHAAILDAPPPPEHASDLSKVREWLSTSPMISELLRVPSPIGIRPIAAAYNEKSVYIFPIEKAVKHVCPYSHSVHSNNTSYFVYHWGSHSLRYKCHHDACREIQATPAGIVIQLQNPEDRRAHHQKKEAPRSLHGRTKWTERYDSPEMRPYPEHPLVCVRANMGTGKTKALDALISSLPSTTTCLIISYQVILCKKYSTTFAKHGFTSYLDIEEELLDADRLIVCLDSLWKVTKRDYNLVIMDEALSVLLHMNSPLMKRSAYVSNVLEVILTQANHVYMLDTAMDHPLLNEFTKELAQKKGATPYRIYNSYVRPTNRKTTMVISKSAKNKLSLQATAMNTVLQLLSKKKRVVVSSSTKSFVDQLSQMVKTEHPKVRVLTYHSATDKTVMSQHMMNPSISWSKADCLIYSPTISAGVSFEEDHYDELVAYVENSPMTPTVDIVLQQLFRVRKLTEGQMTLYIQDQESSQPLPQTMWEIDHFLEREIVEIHKYFPADTLSLADAVATTITREGQIAYDKSRLSYAVLKGIVYAKNQSASAFSSILEETLTSDYGIPVITEDYDAETSEASEVMENMKALTADRKEERKALEEELMEEWTNPLIISSTRRAELEIKQIRGETLQPKDKQDAWAYDVIHSIYKVDPTTVDQAFMAKYVGVCDKNKTTEATKSLFTYKRLDWYLLNTFEENQRAFHRKMREMLGDAMNDRNVKLYRAQTKRCYKMLLEGQCLLDYMFGESREAKESLGRGEPVRLTHEELTSRFEGYMKGMEKERYLKMTKLFKMNRHYKDREEVTGPKIRAFVKFMVWTAFGMEIETTPSKSKNVVTVHGFNVSAMLELKTRYGSKAVEFATAKPQLGRVWVEEEEYVSSGEESDTEEEEC
jgi:hypothetical protein